MGSDRRAGVEELKAGDPGSLGPYRMIGRLGAGGLSVVFLAEDVQGLRYAIKVLRPHLADEQRFRNRLAREAERIMSVAGRHTARVHDIVNEGPYVYLVMDFVEGETLEKLVSNGRRIQGPLLWFMASGLVESVREIHAAGIVHRDLKPSNILIGPDGIVVTDFGFGGILDEGGFARTGTLMGSVAWMSPEQITGGVVDARTDVFNLGLALAYIALGHHPYASEMSGPDSNSLGSGRPEAMMYRISHSTPNITEISSPLREMIARCLAADPLERPSLPELGAFFGSGGTEPITQPSPRIVQASAPPVPRFDVRDRDLTLPSMERPAPQPLEGNRVEQVLVEQESMGRNDIGIPATETFSVPNDFAAPYHGSRVGDGDDDDDLNDDRYRRTVRRRRGAIIAGAVAGLGLIAALVVVDATNVVDIGVIGAVEMATTTSTTTSTTTTVPPTTTTLPPPPVYRLYQTEGNSYRWNPCQNPIKILLNPQDKLTPAQLTALETFLTSQAAELSRLTEMTIEYAGLTEEKSGRGYAFGEEILIHFDAPGADGLLQDDKPFEGTISSDRIKDGFREIDAVIFQYNADALQYLFTDDVLHTYGRWLVMLMLGNAMGLDPLAESDMTAAGSNVEENWEKEIMFFGGRRTVTPEWGPGDIQGLTEVGKTAGCF